MVIAAHGADSTIPWHPEGLPVDEGDLRVGWGYVVVEEIVDQVALLRRWPWPGVDQQGRLQWSGKAEQGSRAVTIPVDLLRAQLYTPNQIERRVRCGDTFAAAGPLGAGWRRQTPVTDVRRLFTGAVFDVSAEARDAAKIAYQAGLAAVQPLPTDDDSATRSLLAAQRAQAPPVAPLLTIAAPPLTPPPLPAARRRSSRRPR